MQPLMRFVAGTQRIATAQRRRAALTPCVAAMAVFLLALPSRPAAAEILLSANDNKMILVDGRMLSRSMPAPDTVSLIRLDRGKAEVIATIDVPTSVLGPPFSIALTPDERLALVTAPLYIDPAGPPSTAADDTVSVLDLQASPPRLVNTVHAGTGAAGISITPDGKLALVANRRAGSVSVFAIDGSTVSKIGTVLLGTPESGVDHAAISPDGKLALVTRDGDNTLSVLAIDGQKVTDTKRDFGVGLKPYGVAIARSGRIAIVANVALQRGDEDTLSVVDLRSSPPRTVNTVSVGQTPEGVALSPDGKWCAIATLNGSNRPASSPFFNPAGKLVLFRIDGTTLTRVADQPIGPWPQGAVFAADSRTLLVGSMTERNVRIFRIGPNGALTDTGERIALPGGNAALRGVERGGR
jgi:DNA-binding beta-propeller fold protein YncE